MPAKKAQKRAIPAPIPHPPEWSELISQSRKSENMQKVPGKLATVSAPEVVRVDHATIAGSTRKMSSSGISIFPI